MKKSTFNGTVLGYLGVTLLAGLVAGITLGILTPWAECYIRRWTAEHSTIDGHQVVFEGKWTELWVKYLVWGLLTLVTLGIYGFWVPVKHQTWINENTHLAD